MSYFMKKVFAAGGGGGGNDGMNSNQSPQQQGSPSPFGGGGGGGNPYGAMQNNNGNNGNNPLTSPTSSSSAFGMANLKSLGSNLVAGMAPQGLANAVQTRKVAGQVSTFLLRIQTSTLGRDRREAVVGLCDLNPAESAEHIRSEDLSMLLMVAEMNRNDTQLLTKIFELISSITEERVVSDAVREPLLHALLESHVSVFLDSLSVKNVGGGAGAPSGPSPTSQGFDNEFQQSPADIEALRKSQTFWVRYHAVKILQRLQEYDGMNLQKQLLLSNSLGSIIDILHDSTNDGALRNEGMILLEHITLTDMELQTILAFDACFETLLEIVHSEGGVNGEVTSVDCLRIIHNMLRNNKATQKFFREMGLGVSLKGLLVDTQYASHNNVNGSMSMAAASPDGRLSPKGIEVVLSTIDIVQCLLRFGDSNGEGLSARDSITQSGLVEPLCRVAFSSKLDDRTSIAALRVVALLAVSHKPTGEQLLSARLNVKDASNVPALWACLHTALYHEDLTHQAAALQIIGAAMQTAGTGAQIASFLVKGLAPTTGGAAAIASQQSGREGGLQCGLLISTCLMSVSPPTPNSRYYAAWVLNQALLVPQITEQMLFLPWGPRQGQTFFLAYVRSLEETIRTRQCNLATVAMLIRPLFTWFAFCGKGIFLFLGWSGNNNSPTSPNTVNNTNTNNNPNAVDAGLASFNFFLEWSNNTRDPMHLRFMCAMVCVAATVACPSHDLPPTVRTNKEDLMKRFCGSVRLGMLEELLYNVSSSPEWTEPPANILHTRSNALIMYDKDYVAILTELSNLARKWLSVAPPPMMQQMMMNGQQQQQQQIPMQQQGGGAQMPMVGGAAMQQPSPMASGSNMSPNMANGHNAANNGGNSSNANSNAAAAAAAAAKMQQQMQHYENIIRQLQSELKTRDDAIVELTSTNEKLVFQNDELQEEAKKSARGGPSSAVGGGPSSADAALVAAKDEEIRGLKATLQKLEARVMGGANNANHNANNHLPSNSNSTPPMSARGAGGGPPSAMNTARSLASNYTAMTDVDVLMQQFEDASQRLRILESERDELLILVAELDEENEVLKQMNDPSTNTTVRHDDTTLVVDMQQQQQQRGDGHDHHHVVGGGDGGQINQSVLVSGLTTANTSAVMMLGGGGAGGGGYGNNNTNNAVASSSGGTAVAVNAGAMTPRPILKQSPPMTATTANAHANAAAAAAVLPPPPPPPAGAATVHPQIPMFSAPPPPHPSHQHPPQMSVAPVAANPFATAKSSLAPPQMPMVANVFGAPPSAASSSSQQHHAASINGAAAAAAAAGSPNPFDAIGAEGSATTTNGDPFGVGGGDAAMTPPHQAVTAKSVTFVEESPDLR